MASRSRDGALSGGKDLRSGTMVGTRRPRLGTWRPFGARRGRDGELIGQGEFSKVEPAGDRGVDGRAEAGLCL